jgi:hypothetical protein
LIQYITIHKEKEKEKGKEKIERREEKSIKKAELMFIMCLKNWKKDYSYVIRAGQECFLAYRHEIETEARIY